MLHDITIEQALEAVEKTSCDIYIGECAKVIKKVYLDLKEELQQIKLQPDNVLAVKELDLARKLFWLAAHDHVFFTSFNNEISYWDDGLYPVILCNDIFVPGADAEPLSLTDLDLYIAVVQHFPEMGSEAWCAVKRSKNPWKISEAGRENFNQALLYVHKILNINQALPTNSKLIDVFQKDVNIQELHIETTQLDLNIRHVEQPIPGDVWEEQFKNICVVLEVTATEVVLCKTTKSLDKAYWTWDLYKTETVSREDFIRYVCYNSEEAFVNRKTWCDVCPQKHYWAVDTYNFIKQL